MTAFDAEFPQTDLFGGSLGVKLPRSGPRPANRWPVARVVLESDLPHLDRLFDYLVPEEMDTTAQEGTRVRVRFKDQMMSGYIRERAEASTYSGSLRFLDQVISPIPVVTRDIFELAEQVADRYAAVAANVLRLAVVPRTVGAEKPYLDKEYRPQEPAEIPPPDLSAFEPYAGAREFLADITEATAARAVVTLLPSTTHTWEDLLARALLTCASSGQAAVAVVPNRKDLDRLVAALGMLTDTSHFAVLSGAQKNSERYRAYLRVLFGEVRIVVGTRSAAYAPVKNPGLLVCWDDGDPNHIEPRSPYCHTRDVLLLRAVQSNCALLFAGYSMSSETARLVRTRWASYLGVDRQVLREHTPHVVSTGDNFQLARDPLAALTRIPHLAFQQARTALKQGPVLVQVSRAGYVPALSCQRCRMPARCSQCRGPLSLANRNSAPGCGWCGRMAHHWRCSECGNGSWRITAAGALRTAEELGRAFTNVPVISSSSDHILTEVSADPALVVATPGAEPIAASGYAAALLLDADSMLRRDSLRAPESALRTWLNAAALVRPRSMGGTVVTTAGESVPLQALIRWDPVRFALRELEERAELFLPPAVRTASITGSEPAVNRFVDSLDLPEEVTVRGPVELEELRAEETGSRFRTILFFSYALAPEITKQLRRTRAASAALKLEILDIRCDGLDIL